MTKSEKYIDTVSGKTLEKRIFYYDNGNIQSESYYLNNQWHREDGPTLIYYYQSGEISQQQFFINGIKVMISKNFPKETNKEDIKENKKHKIFIIDDF